MQSAKVWTNVWRNAVTITSRRNYGGGHKFRQTTMNDLPVPQGDWKALNDKRQSKQNAILAAGVASVSFALFLVTKITNFNFSPPDTYE